METSARAKASEFKRAHQSTASNDLAFRPKLQLDFEIKFRVRLRPKFFVAISVTL
jgi:hypothetical protein